MNLIPIFSMSLRVMVASKNLDKLFAVANALSSYNIIGVSCPSNVNSQPIGEEETATGAKNRLDCLRNMDNNQSDTLYIAIENGLLQRVDRVWCDTAIVMIHFNGESKSAYSMGVPTTYDGDLAKYQTYISEHHNQVVSLFTNGIWSRWELIRDAIKMAVSPINY